MEISADTDEKGLYIALLSVLANLKVPDANLLIRQQIEPLSSINSQNTQE